MRCGGSRCGVEVGGSDPSGDIKSLTCMWGRIEKPQRTTECPPGLTVMIINGIPTMHR